MSGIPGLCGQLYIQLFQRLSSSFPKWPNHLTLPAAVYEAAPCLPSTKMTLRNDFFFFLIIDLAVWHGQILVPWPGMEPHPSAGEAWSLHHWAISCC